MWIRSQDKKYFIEVNAFEIKGIGNVFYIIGYHTENSNDDIYWYLGNYSSEEKAMKVLNMIDSFKNEPLQIEKIQSVYIHCYEKTFQMPQNNEVEV